MQVAPAASSSPGRENHNRLGPDILVAAYNHQTQSRAIETLVCVCVCASNYNYCTTLVKKRDLNRRNNDDHVVVVVVASLLPDCSCRSVWCRPGAASALATHHLKREERDALLKPLLLFFLFLLSSFFPPRVHLTAV